MRNWRGLFVFFVLAVALTAAFGSAFASEETGGMSYTVDFFYGEDGEYHLPGGESMLLAHIHESTDSCLSAFISLIVNTALQLTLS